MKVKKMLIGFLPLHLGGSVISKKIKRRKVVNNYNPFLAGIEKRR
jgi:hypothetical protein|tara:strand:- start:161 stop:295 length:135 start_codon:yes stop_codon:yes gene_type:complete